MGTKHEIDNCTNCGRQFENADLISGKDLIVCRCCGHSQRNPHKVLTDKETEYLRRCNNGAVALQSYNFTLAEESFNQALEVYNGQEVSDSEMLEALWGLVRSYYGIVLVKDFYEGVVTQIYCLSNLGQITPFDENYELIRLKAALENAINSDKMQYEDYIKKAREGINHCIEEEKKRVVEYDYFIACKISKKTNDNPNAEDTTKEAEEASRLYDELTQNGVKVFYSQRCIRENVEYDAQVLNAMLHSEKMILICGGDENSKTYLQTPWVKSEWQRWCYLKKYQIKKPESLIILNIDSQQGPAGFGASSEIGRIQQTFKKAYEKGQDDYSSLTDYLVKLSKTSQEEEKRRREAEEAERTAQAQKDKEDADRAVAAAQAEAAENRRKIAALEKENVALKKSAQAQTAPSQIGTAQQQATSKQDKSSENDALIRDSNIHPLTRPTAILDITPKSTDKPKSVEVESKQEEVGRQRPEAEFYPIRKERPEKKKNKKKISSLIIVALLIIAGIVFYKINNSTEKDPLFIQAQTLYEEGDYTGAISLWEELGVECVWKKGANFYSERVNISKLQDMSEEDSFNVYGLIYINVPSRVTKIDDYTFYNCTSLIGISIPSSVKSIGAQAFLGCSSLGNIMVDENNKNYVSVNGILFNKDKTELICYPEGKTGTSYEIPNGVTSIGELAFEGCTGLASVTIPTSVTSIDIQAFDCRGLESITVYDGNKNYSSSDGVLFNKEKTEIIRYPEGKSGITYEIPNSVTSIGGHAFRYCSSLTSITIPSSVTSIGSQAFWSCYRLESITIPSSVTSIGSNVFVWCNSLASIIVDVGNEHYCSVDGVLFNKDKTELICYPAGKSGITYEIPNSVTSIGDYAFWDCYRLMSITIPSSVTSIGDYAFDYCNNLQITFDGSKQKWKKLNCDFPNVLFTK